MQTAIDSLEEILHEPGAKTLTEVRVQEEGGSWRYAEVTGTNYLHDPEVRGMILAFRDITDRKEAEAKLEAAHKELVRSAREAGMAEVATNVLHNVGNVLSSVCFAASSIQETASETRVANLARVAAMLEEHTDDLGEFLTTDDRGRKLPAYISGLAEHLSNEQNKLRDKATTLSEHVQHVIEIINLQQTYGKAMGFTELVAPAEVMGDALRINAAGLIRHGVQVIRDYEDMPALMLDRHRILQVLTNLISNAKIAMLENEQSSKVLTVSVRRTEGGHLCAEVADNGIGIPEEDITRIFGHGFTTRKEGHGFGLHSAALVAKEMGGSLRCHSDGPGKGASFILEIPIAGEGEDNEH
jgi:signal transduction histidine kinase